MEVLLTILGFAIAAAFLFAYFPPAAWAVGDAQKRGKAGGVVVLLFWLFGPLSALVWLGVRPSTKVVDRSPNSFSNADDALAAAGQLDHLGEWDAAITLYENIARRWPEHHNYIAKCIEHIKSRQALT